MEFHTALFTLWCMSNLKICQEHMNEVSDKAMQATNNHTVPFMFNLYHEIALPAPGHSHHQENVLISPISIVSLLGMVSAGAQGSTDAEITKVLGWDALNEIAAHSGISRTIDSINSYSKGHDAKVFLGNAVYIKRGIRVLRKYRKALADHYSVDDFLAVDFSNPRTRELINKHVENSTNGLIKESIPPNVINSLTTLVLCNVLYFRAAWEHKFPEILTSNQAFHTSKNTSVQAPFMYQTESFNYGHIDRLGVTVIELKYQAINTSMYVLLPDMDGYNDDPLEAFDAMKKKIIRNQDVIPTVDSYLKKQKVSLSLPKFKLTKDYDLKKYLPKLGVEKVFDAYEADLSGITGEPFGLHLSSVLHKATINVDEKGSEGAASTSGVISSKSARTKNFFANRPFAFYICDKNTRAFLFYGQLVDPTRGY